MPLGLPARVAPPLPPGNALTLKQFTHRALEGVRPQVRHLHGAGRSVTRSSNSSGKEFDAAGQAQMACRSYSLLCLLRAVRPIALHRQWCPVPLVPGSKGQGKQESCFSSSPPSNKHLQCLVRG